MCIGHRLESPLPVQNSGYDVYRTELSPYALTHPPVIVAHGRAKFGCSLNSVGFHLKMVVRV